ncbi:hypothetical protein GAY28_09895 [Azospirillum brasilense]|nr:hypothetical protein [Azospirillum brasilense]
MQRFQRDPKPLISQINVKLSFFGVGNDKKQPCGLREIMQTLGGKWILHIHYKEWEYGPVGPVPWPTL